MLIASHSRSSIGSLLYFCGISHHSRLTPAAGAAGDGITGDDDTAGDDTDATTG